MFRFIVTCCLVFFYGNLFSQGGYSSLAQQATRLQALARNHPQHVKLQQLTKTAGGKDVWWLTLGKGMTSSKPAIAIVGGVEGSHLLGTELAIGFAENLMKAPNRDSILDHTTFYVFPNMSPDAMEQYFAPLQYERNGNSRPTDEDRDGNLDEDGFEDLDKDGKITFMRVSSPVGIFKLHPDDPRVLIRADLAKGEKGQYLLYPEGIDNDKDGKFNEDGSGGVAFNRNFSFKHPSFTPGAGEYPVSENENRALLDTLFARFNVFSVVSFGPHNNLSQPYAYNAATANATLIGSPLLPDVRIDSTVSDLYNKIVTAKDAPRNQNSSGDFASWAYYHYGRYSFSTPGWWTPKAKPDTAKKEKALTVDDPAANYLRWAGREELGEVFTPWKKIQHPDFPDTEVEVGGLHPFALINPPFRLVGGIVDAHTKFIVALSRLQPQVDLVNLKTEKLGDGLTRITVDMVNRGALATASKLGERTYWVKRVGVKLKTGNNATVVSGRPVQTVAALEGYGSQTFSWLVRGTGTVTIEGGSPSSGTKTLDIKL